MSGVESSPLGSPATSQGAGGASALVARLTEPLLEVLYAHRRSMTDFDRCECGYERESIMPPGRWIDHQVREVAAVLADVFTDHVGATRGLRTCLAHAGRTATPFNIVCMASADAVLTAPPQ